MKDTLSKNIELLKKKQDQIWQNTAELSKDLKQNLKDITFCINYMENILKTICNNKMIIQDENNNNTLTFIISQKNITINNKKINYDIFMKFYNYLYKYLNIQWITENVLQDDFKIIIEYLSFMNIINTLKLKSDTINNEIQEIYENTAIKLSGQVKLQNDIHSITENVNSFIDSYNKL